jgi:lactate dehydrogenase-like 2-hydroxyacid dehydrogenase
MDNVIVSTHIAGQSTNSLRNMGLAAVDIALTVLAGGKPDPSCIVNPQAK